MVLLVHHQVLVLHLLRDVQPWHQPTPSQKWPTGFWPHHLVLVLHLHCGGSTNLECFLDLERCVQWDDAMLQLLHLDHGDCVQSCQFGKLGSNSPQCYFWTKVKVIKDIQVVQLDFMMGVFFIVYNFWSFCDISLCWVFSPYILNKFKSKLTAWVFLPLPLVLSACAGRESCHLI